MKKAIDSGLIIKKERNIKATANRKKAHTICSISTINSIYENPSMLPREIYEQESHPTILFTICC